MMKIITLLALTCAIVGQVSPLSDEQKECVDIFLSAVEPLSIPEDVQVFVETHGRGSAPAGCKELESITDSLYAQVPCAKKFSFGDPSLHEALRVSPKVSLLFRSTAVCAMAEAGFLRE